MSIEEKLKECELRLKNCKSAKRRNDLLKYRKRLKRELKHENGR